MRLYQDAVRPLLFHFDPEGVHHATMKACAAAGTSGVVRALAASMFGTPADARLATTVAGVRFPNPVGLGAGYDKNGEGVELLSRLGFGYIDVGSVSYSPSNGNAARPRLFRIPADEGLMVCASGSLFGSTICTRATSTPSIFDRVDESSCDIP